MSGDIVKLSQPEGGTSAIYWTEARGAIKHSTVHRESLRQTDVTPNVNGAELEKP